MRQCGRRGAGQSSAARRGWCAGVCFFFRTLFTTHSLVALLSFSSYALSSQLRPASGVTYSTCTRRLSPGGFFPVFPSDVPRHRVASSLSVAPLTASTPSSSSLAASLFSDLLPHRLVHSVEATADAASAAAAPQRTKDLSTLTPPPIATGRDLPSFPARVVSLSPAAGGLAPRAPPLGQPVVAAISAGASRGTAVAADAAAVTFPSSANRPPEAAAVFDYPASSAAVASAAASHSSACENLCTSVPLSTVCGAAGAPCPSRSTSAATGAPACTASRLWQLRKWHEWCFLLAAPNERRCAPSREQPQQLRRGFFVTPLSLSPTPTCWTSLTQERQPVWQAPGASLSNSSGTHRYRKGTGGEGGRRRRSSWRSGNCRSCPAAAAASTCAPSWREKSATTTALFDSQEERFSALKSLKEQETPKFQAEDWTPEKPLLEVKDLHVVAVEDGQEILKGVNLTVMPGEVHAIMGRNGSGKSTLSKVLAGYPSYKVTRGTVRFKGLDLLELAIDNRGLAGLFLAFQYPIEIPMVSNLEFLRVAFNERRKWRGEEEVDSVEFRQFVEGKLQEVGLDPSFLSRPLNYGFSGGEKKRNEILQMIVLDPELVMLDETDSGLDVDSFNVTAAAIKRFATRKNKSFLVTTHYKKLLDVLLPHRIHVMHAGRVILSGDMSLASRIEKEGFASLISDDPREEEEEKRGLTRGENLLDNDAAYEPPSLSPSAAGGGRRDFDKLL